MIDTVRVDGLKAAGGSAGNVVRVQNSGTSGVMNVALRNAVLTCGSGSTDAAAIVNAGSGSLSGVLLEGFTVLVPSTTAAAAAVRISGAGAAVIDGVRWSGGGVRPTSVGTATLSCRYVVVRNANNVQLFGLRLDGSTAQSPGSPIGVGDGADSCKSVVFGDVAITRVNGQTGGTTTTAAVTFDRTVNCGFIRGSIAGSDNAFAVRLTSFADSCFIEDADLTGIVNASTNGSLIDVATSKPYRLTNNAVASTQAPQRSAFDLGPPVTVDLAASATTITVTSSFVALNPAGSSPTLNRIETSSTQSLPGDLLVLTLVAGKSVTVNDFPGTSGGNIRLQATGSVSLSGNDGDTLTLLCRGSDWVQLARSSNG